MVYYSSETDPQSQLDKTKPLAIYLKQPTTIADKKFGLLLEELMVENGFTITNFNTDGQKPPCFITFSTDISSYQQTNSYTTYHTQTTYISGSFIGNSYNPGTTITTTTPSTNFYTDIILHKNIGISIFCKNKNGEDSQIWFGFVNADIEYYENYERNILQNLINLIGKDFKGEIDVSQVKKDKN